MAWLYGVALICGPCAEAIRARLAREGQAPGLVCGSCGARRGEGRRYRLDGREGYYRCPACGVYAATLAWSDPDLVPVPLADGHEVEARHCANGSRCLDAIQVGRRRRGALLVTQPAMPVGWPKGSRVAAQGGL